MFLRTTTVFVVLKRKDIFGFEYRTFRVSLSRISTGPVATPQILILPLKPVAGIPMDLNSVVALLRFPEWVRSTMYRFCSDRNCIFETVYCTGRCVYSTLCKIIRAFNYSKEDESLLRVSVRSLYRLTQDASFFRLLSDFYTFDFC